jgi:hypothetical protein
MALLPMKIIRYIKPTIDIDQPKAAFPKRSIAFPTIGGPSISPKDRKKIKQALAEAKTLPLNSWPSKVSPKE